MLSVCVEAAPNLLGRSGLYLVMRPVCTRLRNSQCALRSLVPRLGLILVSEALNDVGRLTVRPNVALFFF